MSYQTTPDEQETTINLFPTQIQQHAEVYSSTPGTIRKLRKLAAENPDEVVIEKEDEIGIFVQVPANWIQIRKPKKMNFSEERREAAAERMRALRSKQLGQDVGNDQVKDDKEGGESHGEI